MNKLKILLLFSFLYLFSLSINQSNLDENTKSFKGKILKIDTYQNFSNITLKRKEKIIVKVEEISNLKIGYEIEVFGKLEKPENNNYIGLFNYKNYLKSQKIYYTMNSNKIEVLSKKRTIINNLNEAIYNKIKNYKSKDYLKSFVFGDINIEQEVLKSYQINGVIHLLAISSSHVAIIILLLKKKRLIIPFLILYLFITGFKISLVRAAFFYFFNLVNKNKVNNLIYLAMILLIINPYLIYDIGFIFSFVITFYILTMKEKKSIFNVSLIAYLSSLPIILYNFFETNILSPIINIFFVPLFSIILFPLSLLALVFKEFDYLLFYLLNLTENLSLFLTQYEINIVVGKISYIYIIIYYISLYKLKNIVLKTIVCSFIILTFNLNIEREKITFLDVGQGDSALIEFKKGTLMVDTGGTFFKNKQIQNKTIPYLKSRGIKEIDILLITHGDLDHIANSIDLINNFKVNSILINSGSDNEFEKKLIHKGAKKIGSSNIYLNDNLLNIYNYKNNKSENKDSLIVKFKINDKKILLMGDSYKEEELKLISENKIEDIDILKVGHHGSKTSTDNNFIKAIKPKYSVLSLGKNNFGHPSSQTIETLSNTIILSTQKHGSIQFNLSKNLTYKTAK